MKRIKQLVAPVHLWLGLGSGLILVIVAITGCIWAFEEEIRYVTQRETLYVTPVPGAPRASVEAVTEAISQLEPKIKINQIRLFGEPGKAINVYSKDKQLITLNPYTAEIISVRSTENDPMLTILSLHRTLLLGDIGKKIIYWNTWVFIVMLVSGLILWVPRKINQWRKYFTVRNCGNRKVYNYKLHSVGGMYFAPLLLLTAVTGLSIATHSSTKDTAQSVVRPVTDPERLADVALGSVWKGEPFESIRVIPAKDSTDLLRVTIRYATSNFRKESSFGFDQYSGALLVAKRHTEQSGWDKFWKSDFEIHTGRIWGLPGKILAFFTGLAALMLPVTGFLLWYWKRRAPKAATRKKTGKPIRIESVVQE
ncbi:MAG: PepSY domain-containing protein [Bacteroidetes bacterium]|nr:PepSY domain-containing protein [Bacteroidota bacterium]